MRILSILLSTLFLSSAYSQESDSVLFKYDFDLGFGTYYQATTYGKSQLHETKIPKSLPRRISEPSVRDQWGLANDRVTDNPFFHGAYCFRLGGNFVYDSSLYLTAAANFEQRGFSDGQFSKQTRNFFPYFNARYVLNKNKLKLLMQIGDINELRLYEGLTFYNLPAQSWLFKLKHNNFYFKHVGIADLIRNIGLGIDDVYDYSVGFDEVSLNKTGKLLIDASVGYSNNRGGNDKDFYNVSSRVYHPDHWSAYTQFSSRKKGKALLVGVQHEKQWGNKLSLNTRLEYRQFNAAFNQGYTNTVYYRNPNIGAVFQNSTNNVFFPLDYYERSFNQWAVFTEYQGIGVSGINFKADAYLRLFAKTYLKLILDYNYIRTDKENFSYPFYNIGLGNRLKGNIDIFIEFTNKTLNLDKNYPSFYVAKKPYLFIHAFKPFKFMKANDEFHRF